MEKISRLTTEQRAELVAYLDGELDEKTTQQIEQTLAVNAVARHEVDMLSRTLDLLDELPKADASDGFTKRTMTLLTSEETQSQLSINRWMESGRRVVIVSAWVAAVCLAAMLGFYATNRWMPNDSDLLIQDFEVIDNLDMYSEIEEMEFLRGLQRSGLFDESSQDEEP